MLNQATSNLPIFAGLSKKALALIEPLLELSAFPANELIFEQGQFALYLYIILEGEVLIRFKPYDGPALDVAHLGPGGVFGWSSALGRSAYTSGAMSLTDIQAIRIRGDRLHQLCEQHPDIGVIVLERLANVIAERLQNTREQIMDMLTSGLSLKGDYRRRSMKNE
jgi:CRP-like cAMP-binding protein